MVFEQAQSSHFPSEKNRVFLNKNTSGCLLSMFFLELSNRVSIWGSEKSIVSIVCESKLWLVELCEVSMATYLL